MFSSEQTQNECGPVYIREKGILRSVNEPVFAKEAWSYRTTKPSRLFRREFSVELCVEDRVQAGTHTKRKEHFVFTYNKEGSLRYSVKSLFNISLLFIAENVQYIDSLLGFPEQMAERLFRAAEAKQKFSDTDYGPRALQCLDLFGCKLGDDHELLQHLTSETLSSLVQLSLGDNHLSNRGIQKLTAPVRVMKKGLENLQLLDLSWNPISEQVVGYLSCFPNLRGLDISETNMEVL
ncbi:hypothetical protein JZ751_014268 [Albula glossodonta]|uniref:Leucine-rich repeat-containing protein 42 n=1 Tax=Albula glossodonta TaxID=121402 RepID=A0A8T2P3S2_9TELE|nr:hypothetical protein JZ751_014268 [Albula glossodonta]